MKIWAHGAFGFLKVLGLGALSLLVIGLVLEGMTTLRAKARDLKVLPRERGLLYVGIALAVVVALFVVLAVAKIP